MLSKFSTLRATLLGGAALAIIAIASPSGARAEAWTIDYTAQNGDSAMLNVIVDNTANADGSHTVTDISGTHTVPGATSMVTGLSPYAAADQELFQVDPYVDFSGLSFTADGISYNLFTQNGYFEISSAVDSVGYPQSGVAITDIKVADVPEPASLAILGVGLAGLGLSRRRAARTSAAAA